MSKVNKINSWLSGPWNESTGPLAKRIVAKRRRNLKDLNPEQLAEVKQTFVDDGYDLWRKEYYYCD